MMSWFPQQRICHCDPDTHSKNALEVIDMMERIENLKISKNISQRTYPITSIYDDARCVYDPKHQEEREKSKQQRYKNLHLLQERIDSANLQLEEKYAHYLTKCPEIAERIHMPKIYVATSGVATIAFLSGMYYLISSIYTPHQYFSASHH